MSKKCDSSCKFTSKKEGIKSNPEKAIKNGKRMAPRVDKFTSKRKGD